MQERDELRALKREIKMLRERKVNKKICVWKRKKRKTKKERSIKKEKREKKKRERGMVRKI
jgi:hypothetical protein